MIYRLEDRVVVYPFLEMSSSRAGLHSSLSPPRPQRIPNKPKSVSFTGVPPPDWTDDYKAPEPTQARSVRLIRIIRDAISPKWGSAQEENETLTLYELINQLGLPRYLATLSPGTQGILSVLSLGLIAPGRA